MSAGRTDRNVYVPISRAFHASARTYQRARCPLAPQGPSRAGVRRLRYAIALAILGGKSQTSLPEVQPRFTSSSATPAFDDFTSPPVSFLITSENSGS